ncbi:MAG: peptidoglycan DD-metalloendopeptidase family protein [Deltaproteobacteria bacterium]|nr:peptidoglycan DD-metalloendopeptidase family protein [Deltaproteobacteria bacterium]
MLRSILIIACICAWIGCAPRTVSYPPKKPQGIYHVVRPGENLFRIGRAYDINHETLARLNRIRDPSQLRAGQRIFIPGAARQLPVDIITPAEPPTEPPGLREPAEPEVERFLWPVSGTINSGFGPRGATFHDGVDISAPEGTPIRAIEKGEVIYSDQLRGYGNMVILRHADGYVGNTGNASGGPAHLHFEIRKNNRAQDPGRYFPRLCCAPASVMVSPEGQEAGL